uniref:Uncharacterized protein n=1 Tax=Panagrolaimus sp. JU765 TaxID=591449 RepID=A0AC34Q6A9_9BILA
MSETVLDIEAIVNEILSIIVDTEKQKMDHETLSTLIKLFEKKYTTFNLLHKELMNMTELRNYIKDLESVSKLHDTRLNLVAGQLIEVYNLLTSVKIQTDKLRAHQLKNEGLEYDSIIRAAQQFAPCFADPGNEEHRNMKPFVNRAEIKKSSLINMVRSSSKPVKPGSNLSPNPPFFPSLPIRRTLGKRIILKKPSLIRRKVVKKKKPKKKVNKKPKPKKNAVPSPPILIRKKRLPKIKYIRQSVWHEQRAFQPVGTVSYNWPINLEPEIFYNQDIPSLDMPVYYPIPRLITRSQKKELLNRVLQDDDDNGSELFFDEDRMNPALSVEDQTTDDDDDEFDEQWYQAKFYEMYKQMNPPEKDAMITPKFYRLPQSRPQLYENLRKSSSSLWQSKYGRFYYRHRFRQPNIVCESFEFPDPRRENEFEPPNDVEQFSWNLRKWNGGSGQFPGNM